VVLFHAAHSIVRHTPHPTPHVPAPAGSPCLGLAASFGAHWGCLTISRPLPAPPPASAPAPHRHSSPASHLQPASHAPGPARPKVDPLAGGVETPPHEGVERRRWRPLMVLRRAGGEFLAVQANRSPAGPRWPGEGACACQAKPRPSRAQAAPNPPASHTFDGSARRGCGAAALAAASKGAGWLGVPECGDSRLVSRSRIWLFSGF
jgi:hypothetical protein